MDSNKTSRFSWFWKWFLNNKVVTALLISLLVLLNILLFSKLSYLFEPIWQFINAVALPVILASILFYILNPMVDWLEKRKVPRVVSIVLLFILILALLTIGILILIPKIQSQVESFIVNWPSYWEVIEKSTNDLMSNQYLGQFKPEIEDLNNNIYNTIGDFIKNISKTTFSGIGNFVGAVANIVVAVITMPFVLFFLLKDGKKLLPSFVNLLPIRIRNATSRILIDVNNQVSQYIRGQLIVAFAVAVMFIIGFSIIGLNYGFTLGIMAGFLNLIPYLGSFLAMVPAVLLGAVTGPVMLIKVILVFIIEQTIEGRFVSPLVLSNKLDIHPLTIIFVLLASGKMFGVAGVILGIPGYAVIKVLATHLFMWYQQVSGLYDSNKPALPAPLKQEKES